MRLLTHYLTFFTTVIVLSACATVAPTRFFTLSNIGHSGGSEHLITNATQIDLRPVIVPERLKRTQIVLNSPNSTALIFLENERWASAFNDELHDAISAELNKQLANETSRTENTKNYRLLIELHRLEAISGQSIKAEFSWKITPLSNNFNEEKISSCQLQLTEPVGSSTELIVQGMQHMVLKLSTTIAESIKNFNTTKANFCQSN